MAETKSILLTDELKSRLPGLGSAPFNDLDSMTVHAGLFLPGSKWSWYVLEFDGTGTFLAIVVNGSDAVVGQVTLQELEALHFRDEAGREVRVRVDPEFSPKKVGELAADIPSLKSLPAPHATLVELKTDDTD
jgi:hypothetical protein